MVEIKDKYWIFNTDLTIDTVHNMSIKYNKYLNCLKNSWTIDFVNCNNIDTSGLALIIEYIKYAKSNNVELQLKNLSSNTLLLAKVHGIKIILDQYIKHS